MFKKYWFKPNVNQAMRLSLGLLCALALAWPFDLVEPVATSMLVLPPVLVSAFTIPSPRWKRRIGLGLVGFFLSSGLTATIAREFYHLLPLWFAVLGLLLGSTYAWGELSGRLGRGVLAMAVVGLGTHNVGDPWLLALGYSACALWLVGFSRLWYHFWRHDTLRQALAEAYVHLARIIVDRPAQLRAKGLPAHFDPALGRQLQQCRNLLGGLSAKKDGALKNAFMAAVDLQERLQATPHPEQAQALFTSGAIFPLYRRWTRAVASRLLRLSRDLSYHREISNAETIRDDAAALVEVLEDAAKVGGPRGMVAHYMAGNVQRITRLAERAAPLYQRDATLDEGQSSWSRWRTMMVWSSPVMRGAVRLALMLGMAGLASEYIDADNGYWILTTIVMVTESSFVATKSRAWLRVMGTLVGLTLAAGLVQIGVTGQLALALSVVLLPITLICVPIHHGYTTVGATMILVLMFESLGFGGDQILLPRALDTLIGCAVVFGAYRWLWPQWQGGRQAQLRRQAMAHLHRYLQLLLITFEGKPVETVQLARARRLAYEQGVALTASYYQMKQEPGFEEAEHKLALMAKYKGAVAHLNAVVPLARRGLTLPPETAQRLLQVFDEAYRNVMLALDENVSPWPTALADEQAWLYDRLAEQGSDRTGFLYYQMALLLDRYQALYQLVKQDIAPKG